MIYILVGNLLLVIKRQIQDSEVGWTVQPLEMITEQDMQFLEELKTTILALLISSARNRNAAVGGIQGPLTLLIDMKVSTFFSCLGVGKRTVLQSRMKINLNSNCPTSLITGNMPQKFLF